MSGIRLTEVDDATIATPPAGKSTLILDDVLGWAHKDDDGVTRSLQGADGELTYLDHGNTGATETITASDADIHRLVANAATVTLTLAGWPASGSPAIVRCWLEQDGTGGRIWAWPGAVNWGDAGEPDWAARGPGDIDTVDLMTVDGGTNVVAVLQGRPGTTGADGVAGGAISIPYVFSTTTTDADPGAGNLRLSNATQTSATVIRADLLASDGTDWSAVLATFADSTNTVKGHIRLFKTDDPTKWLVFSVSALASPSGYKNITVANVAGSSASPFSNADAITLAFTRAGDVGAAGTASVGTDGIWDAAGDLAVGTGADTASRLALGANGTWPMSNGTTLAYRGFIGCKAKNNVVETFAAAANRIMLLNDEDIDTHSFHFTSAAALTGTVAKTATSPNIVGTGTSFTTELSVNQVITIPGTATEVGVVKTITDNTNIELWQTMANTASGQTATRRNEYIAIPAGFPTNGKWRAHGATFWTSYTGSGFSYLIIAKNAAEYPGSSNTFNHSAYHMSGQQPTTASPGDYFTMRGLNGSSASSDLGGNSPDSMTCLTIEFLGA